MCTFTRRQSDSSPACLNPDKISEASSCWCNEDVATKVQSVDRSCGVWIQTKTVGRVAVNFSRREYQDGCILRRLHSDTAGHTGAVNSSGVRIRRELVPCTWEQCRAVSHDGLLKSSVEISEWQSGLLPTGKQLSSSK